MKTGREEVEIVADRAPVTLSLPGWAGPLVDACRTAGEDADVAVKLAAHYGRLLPHPGSGQTAQRWAVLAAAAEHNLTVARVLEAHSDALAILAEAGEPVPDGAWGVFAAEAAPHRLDAADAGGHAELTGVKPWCSLADRLDAALVTAHADGHRQLFRVSLHHPSVTPGPPDGWVARGLRNVTSVGVRFDRTPAEPVGPPGWYLARPGFAWGGMGVAACWHGGSRGLRATLLRRSAKRSGDLSALHVGIVDAELHASGAALAGAAALIDAGSAQGAAGVILGLRVRAVVARAAERIIRQVGHALGPAPLAFDEDHARRVADLELYLRQHHAERDLARLGDAVLAGQQDGHPG
ncbi:MAG: acyl-CoA dehydrogenase [Streptosporangiaceae bacterium]|nr:acyl-CoA dehydrogenase [Streptosporangiaceae bacterium]